MEDQYQFIDAAKDGDLDAVKTCIAQAGDDARELLTAWDFRAFRWACLNGQTGTAAHLLTTADAIDGLPLIKDILSATIADYSVIESIRNNVMESIRAQQTVSATIGNVLASYSQQGADSLLDAFNIIPPELRVTMLEFPPETISAALGIALAQHTRSRNDLQDAIDTIPPEWHEHIPNRRRLILEAERKEQQELPRGRV